VIVPTPLRLIPCRIDWLFLPTGAINVTTAARSWSNTMKAKIVAATKWQAQTVRGFVSILRSKGREKIESSKNTAGERTNKIGK
jgi:hypothetical protein